MTKEAFTADSVSPLRITCDRIAQLGLESATEELPINPELNFMGGLIRDQETGEWRPNDEIQLHPDNVDANHLLKVLRNISNLRARSRELTSKNIRLVAKLGSTALEVIELQAMTRGKPVSKTVLTEIQATFRHTGGSMALALGFSDLPRKAAQEEFRAMQLLVSPNWRTAGAQLRRILDEE